MTALTHDIPLWGAPVTHRLGVAMAFDGSPYATELSKAIERAAADAGCAVTFAETEDAAGIEMNAVRSLRAGGIDGILLTPAAGDDVVVTGLVRLGVPTVLMERLATRGDVDQVGTENIQAMCDLVRHLASAGHERIGLISGAVGVAVNDERALGYRLGLGRAGLAWQPDLVACGESTAGGAAAATGRLLDMADAPTALVVASEAMMIGVHYEVHRRGLRIGEELGLAGYGDAEWMGKVDPALTTMAQPIEEIGRRAVHTLIARISDPDRRPDSVRLAPSFMHRTSCGCPRRRQA
ncbi:LacI family DNA-binding transcriptional regulator [Amycolatopsis sp. YIM 10]|uniref:LacI family DNA-binding transcriptional regulator n=1 Tax=Amycolatopsis sp. YIM 10 TaxID=2653857 RepID=UPI00129027ED|nr:substrate-binding domain-containing protein [Amycolatopsis sp. YIM 10]QFU94506.1 Ribose operon repressor [Amycolatopsis sp. YIM 10]